MVDHHLRISRLESKPRFRKIICILINMKERKVCKLDLNLDQMNKISNKHIYIFVKYD